MKNRTAGTVCVLLSALAFSLAGILIKFISWSPITINGARCVFAAAVMIIYMAAARHKFVFNRMVLFGAVCNVIMNICFVAATKLTSAANAIVLQFTMPIFIILFSFVFFGKRPRKIELVACAVIFSGIVCFFFGSITSRGMWSNILAVISGAAYAVIFMQKEIPGADFESSAVIGQLSSVVISVPFWFFEHSVTSSDILTVAVLGTVQMGLAYVLLAIGLSSVEPITASLISTVEPIINPLLVAAFYGETIGTVSAVGAVMVIGAVTLYNVFTAREIKNNAG